MSRARVRTWVALACTLAVWAWAVAGSAQDTGTAGPLAEERVVSGALERHPIVLASLQERAAADAEQTAADGAFDTSWTTRAWFDPVGYYRSIRADTQVEQPTPWWGLSLFAGYRYAWGSFPDYYGQLRTNEGGEVRVGANLPLWRDGPIDRRRAGVERARLGRALAEFSVTAQRIEIARWARLRYWDWVVAGLRLRAAERLLQLARDRDQGLAQRVAHGDLPAIERTENQRAILQRESLVVSARRALEQSAIELSFYLRDASGEPRMPRPDESPDALPDPPAAATVSDPTPAEIDESVGRRPEVARARTLGQQGDVDRRLAANQMAPAIDVSALFSADLGAPVGPDGNTRVPPELDLAVRLEVPLQNRVQRGRMRAAEAAVARARLQAQAARERVANEMRDAASAERTACLRAEVTSRELDLARTLEDAERQRFQLGDGSMLLVNLREQATFDAAIRALEAKGDVLRARALRRAARGLE